MTPKVISLFTGIGGLDLGFRGAGFRTAVAVELDPECCRTLRSSRLTRSWPLLEGDIHKIPSGQILRKAGLRRGEAAVLIAGPPCQPFSKAGYWANGDSGRLDDDRADTLSAFLLVLRDTRPRAFLLENVRGLAYRQKRDGLDLLLRGIQAINRKIKTNYTVQWATVDAAAHGVPQHRERVFLVGSRDGIPFTFPRPTHARGNGRESHLHSYLTAWDAIGDLPERGNDPALAVGGKWGDLLPTIPEGRNYLWHTARGGGHPLFGWRTRYWTFLLKLAKNRPAWTIQAHPGTATGPFHWKSRRLSAEELARLQTIPDGLTFSCSHAQIQRMIGNAVPSLLAEVLAREIRVQLLGGRVYAGVPTLLPPDRGKAPPPERRQTLRGKYMHLIGDHADHPGPGLGPGAGVASGARM